MKNKKGFTLVELLAVIAILAILMLLVMPNVLKMFNSGKKNTFTVQVGNIASEAQKQIQADILEGAIKDSYCEGLEECDSNKKLSISDNEVKYNITFNRNVRDERSLVLAVLRPPARRVRPNRERAV